MTVLVGSCIAPPDTCLPACCWYALPSRAPPPRPRLLPARALVFRVTAFGGEPAASDEMAPRYFAEAEVPYERMWADDVHWYPLFLAGKLFEGTFHFHNTHTLVGHTLTEVHSLSLPAQPLQ